MRKTKFASTLLALFLCLGLLPATALAETTESSVIKYDVKVDGTIVNIPSGESTTVTVKNPASGDMINYDPSTDPDYQLTPVTPPSSEDGKTSGPFLITLDANGGSFAGGNSVVLDTRQVNGTQQLKTVRFPSRGGYTQIGWEINGERIEKTAIYRYVFTSDTTVKALWQSDTISYDITFDANGGTFSDGSSIVVEQTTEIDGENVVLPPSLPHREGYAFYKWTPIEDPFDYNYTGDTTIKALWGYRITFFGHDGWEMANRTTNPNGTLDALPEPESYPSHTFLGWSTSLMSDSTDHIIDESHVFTKASKLYAKWALSDGLAVTLDANGGSVTPATIQIGSDGKLSNALPTPTRSGYTFAGWFRDGKQVKQDEMYSAPATLTAKWTRNSKISPSLTATPGSVKAGISKVEIKLICASNEAYLDWRPLERIVTDTPENLESSVKKYITGNFSAVGLKLTNVICGTGYLDFNEKAYPQTLYPGGVCPEAELILTFEGKAKSGAMNIELSSNMFVFPVAKNQNLVLDQASADLFNAAKASVTISGNAPAASAQTAAGTSSDGNSASGTPKLAFTDVAATSPFAPAIGWAVEKGITNGTTPTTFAPSTTCTTGHILTFLWRSQGSPEPTIQNPFKDEIPGAFQKAAVWAYEKGLVSGNAFGSATPCTRAASVTYLWKLAGSPEAKTATFKDVKSSSSYAKAISWAVEQGVTNGTGDGTTFSPESTTTRGQIVTFLYRAYEK